MVATCDFELIAGEFAFRHYAASLYHSLQLLEKYPQNDYLHAIVALSFCELHAAQRRHELGKHAETPDESHSPGFRQLLTLLHNLRLKEMSLIGYHYLAARPAGDEEAEILLFARVAASRSAAQEAAFQAAKTAYLQQFPRGKYREAIENL